MRSLVSGVLLTAAAMIAGQASAEDVMQWPSTYGFQVGDEGGYRISPEGLGVRWVAESSYTDGRMSVVAEFCDIHGSGWEGGMRLTHIPPERGHLTLNVPAGGCVSREEIIPSGVDMIYIYLKSY